MTTDMTAPDLLTEAEAAKQLRMSRDWLSREARDRQRQENERDERRRRDDQKRRDDERKRGK